MQQSLSRNISIHVTTLLTLIALSITGQALACFEPTIRDRAFSVKGTATDLEGALLYTEELTQVPSDTGGMLTVRYADANNREIAFKEVDYNCNPTTPSFVLTDLVNDTREGVTWNEDHLDSFQGNNTSRMDHPKGAAVVDAGFDNVIKLNWDLLLKGESVKFQYLFARRNKFLKLRFKKSAAPKELKGKVAAGTVFFKVGANNMIFRMLSSPIYVGYEAANRELKYYFGPTNLPMLDMEKNLLISYEDMK